MIKFIDKETSERYDVQTVARAIARTDKAVASWCSNRGISVKDGITEEQVVEMCKLKGARDSIKWAKVHKLRRRLEERYGILITEEDEIDQQTKLDT